MAQPFCEETSELLDRAQRAIDRAIQVRDHTRRCIIEAANRAFQLELAAGQRRTRSKQALSIETKIANLR
ncbi:hypothetical protein [Bradyrhizobium pachyrhizi]|uniref:hypothetical protein n=1 Tax=Bradyrhizobium pachyrhizi TaxID=280333 RepID=UPI00128F4B2F|nr:hypothetical protein [Bradyrhizobium pachyrhizi]